MFQPSHFIAHNSKRIIAISAIAISLLAAVTLAGVSQSSASIWAAAHQLASGTVITAADITRVDATLGRSSKGYYPSSSRLIGNVVTRPIGTLEFIPLNALAQPGSTSDFREMPLGIAKSDLPTDLAPGERVDLYSIPKDAGAQTELVAVDIHIKNVDNRSRDLGGAVSVLFLLHEKEIMAVMDSLTSGRVVVVRHAL
jgi:hypothetical protein